MARSGPACHESLSRFTGTAITKKPSLASHRVSPDEVEEVLFGVDGDEAVNRQLRDGDYLKIYGETRSGRLLKLVGEFMRDGRFRVFAAQDMDDKEKRAFRKR